MAMISILRVSPARWLRGAGFAFCTAVIAVPATARVTEEFLLPEEAFKVSGQVSDDRSVELNFDIAPGYYLYREQFQFTAASAALGAAAIPPGPVKFDETFQKDVETHRGALRVRLPVTQAAGPFRLVVRYQGCADKGLCYPPQEWQAEVRLPAFGGVASLRVLTAVGDTSPASQTSPSPAASTAAEAASPPSGRTFADSSWQFWAGALLLAMIAAAFALRRILAKPADDAAR